jgi:hypothetical protein
VKISEFLTKLRLRPAKPDDGERSGDSIDERAAVSEAESYSAYVPSQQDEKPKY